MKPPDRQAARLAESPHVVSRQMNMPFVLHKTQSIISMWCRLISSCTKKNLKCKISRDLSDAVVTNRLCSATVVRLQFIFRIDESISCLPLVQLTALLLAPRRSASFDRRDSATTRLPFKPVVSMRPTFVRSVETTPAAFRQHASMEWD